MITVKSNARKGVVVSSKLLLDSTTTAEFKDFPKLVEKMANQAGFEHMLEESCQGVSSVVSKTFNRIVTIDELEEFEKCHMAWLEDIRGKITAACNMIPVPAKPADQEATAPESNNLLEKDIEFLKDLQEMLNKPDEDGDEVPFAAHVCIAGMLPVATIGNRLLKTLVKDAINKYVRLEKPSASPATKTEAGGCPGQQS